MQLMTSSQARPRRAGTGCRSLYFFLFIFIFWQGWHAGGKPTKYGRLSEHEAKVPAMATFAFLEPSPGLTPAGRAIGCQGVCQQRNAYAADCASMSTDYLFLATRENALVDCHAVGILFSGTAFAASPGRWSLRIPAISDCNN